MDLLAELEKRVVCGDGAMGTLLLDPDYFVRAAREMATQDARLIGGCCGITPAHIAAVSKVLVDLRPDRSRSACLVD
jgi:methionine synthase I (cobalamin-dependent)